MPHILQKLNKKTGSNVCNHHLREATATKCACTYDESYFKVLNFKRLFIARRNQVYYKMLPDYSISTAC